MTTSNKRVESSGTPPSTYTEKKWYSGILSFSRQLAQRPLSFIGTLITLLFIFLAIFGPTIAPYDFDEIIRDENSSIVNRAEPSLDYPFGTDRRGFDVFSRVIWGAREIITLPGIATVISVVIGATIGMTIAFLGGWIDEAVSRVLDSLLSLPALVFALVMLGVAGPSEFGIIIVVVLLYVPIVTRIIRSATLGVRNLGYVEAARLRGESTLYILFREIFPAILPALAVEAALRFSYAIFLVASLGFLGLGVQPPSPDWGRLVAEARGDYLNAPWTLWFPALAIAILVIGVNLMADGLRRIFRYEGSR